MVPMSAAVSAADIEAAVAIDRIRQLAGVIIGNTVSVPTNGRLDTATAGLSGERLRPLNLALLKAVKPHAAVPLIACGGILVTPPASPNTGLPAPPAGRPEPRCWTTP